MPGLPGAHQAGCQITMAGEFTVTHQPGGPLALGGVHQFLCVGLRAHAVAADLYGFFQYVVAVVLGVGNQGGADA